MKRPGKILALLISLVIVVGAAWYFYDLQNQAPTRTFTATAKRDCAPWDGSAFTVTFQYDAETIIDITIWKSPEITSPSSFRFTDDEGQVGNALISSGGGAFVPMRGKVWFERVEEGVPVEGRFSLTSESGVLHEGGFVAEWESQIVYCG
ncbi:MAG: hypothetical protein IT314_11780 [Anaerolineales bacterium]|nr:hypothetical protein [Anaerolineales bacterium]